MIRIRLQVVFLFVALVALAGRAEGAPWYVAPSGKADNAGTQDSPWDIESALSGGHPIQPGDTIYLSAGTYRRRPDEQFAMRLTGDKDRPIHVRLAPAGGRAETGTGTDRPDRSQSPFRQRVTIDGGLAVHNPSAYVWIWDLEILVSEPDTSRDKPVTAGSHPEDFRRPWGGLNVFGGVGCKYINLVIHDCRQGVSFWSGATDSELHACIIYDNGWTGTDRGHGHAIYTQNQDGVKTISDCIMTGGRSYTMHAYGSSRAYVDNYLIEGNVAYNAGPFLIGGGRPSRNIRVLDNYLYNVGMQIGYTAPNNENCEVRNNVIVGGGLSINNYREVIQDGNLVIGSGQPRPADAPARVILRPNRYDPQRAHLIVYNWAKNAEVEVHPDGFLKTGDRFQLLDPRDVYGKPVVEGQYSAERFACRSKASLQSTSCSRAFSLKVSCPVWSAAPCRRFFEKLAVLNPPEFSKPLSKSVTTPRTAKLPVDGGTDSQHLMYWYSYRAVLPEVRPCVQCVDSGLSCVLLCLG